MRLRLATAVFAALSTPALAGDGFDAAFYRFLTDQGLAEQAFAYAVTWAGTSDAEAETAVAYALLDGVGVRANPKAAIAMVCRSAVIDPFDASKILIQGNLRLAAQDFEPIRCEPHD